MNMDVSVVVPTYQRQATLDCCLEALLHLERKGFCYEILIVDNAASAQTRQQVEQWIEHGACRGVPIRYLATTQKGPAAARNLGWRESSGRIIAFTDDDCIPDPRWLQAGLAAFSADVEAVSGRIIVPLQARPSDYEYNAAQLTGSEFATANCFYLRSTLQRVGGFDERFTAAWREDSDLFFTLLQQQCRCVFVDDAVVVHPVRPASWGISIRQQQKSMFNALLYKKHPRFYRQRVQARPPWHYYSILGASLLLLYGILRRSKLPATCGFGLWLALTSRFCLQRLHRTKRTPAHIAEMIVTSALIPPLALFWRIRGAIKFRVFFL